MSDTKRPAEVLSAEEVAALGGFPTDDSGAAKIAKLLATNPGAIKDKLQLSETQAQNVSAIIIGGSTGASVKYLGPVVGNEIAAVLGALTSAYVSRKMFGKGGK